MPDTNADLIAELRAHGSQTCACAIIFQAADALESAESKLDAVQALCADYESDWVLGANFRDNANETARLLGTTIAKNLRALLDSEDAK